MTRDSKRQKTGEVPAGVQVATARCSSNIAVIKYWGKRDEKLLLPINSSLSVSMDPSQLGTLTTAAASEDWEGDRLWLNGKEEDAKSERIQNCLRAIRSMAGAGAPKGGLRIVSENNFPTAAGLASSASGYACLVLALGKLFGITDDLSVVARQGSGSACRSVYGGFVKWEMGKLADGSDSRAYQVAKAEHWPELHALICVVSDEKKKVSSTSGMETSVKTSQLLAHRAAEVVQPRMEKMEKAIHDKNFEVFAQITMADSNQFHATCLDTYPPIFYLNDTSRAIIYTIHELNKAAGKNIAAYTFDAGPNAVVYVLEENLAHVARALALNFPPKDGGKWEDHVPDAELLKSIKAMGDMTPDKDFAGKVKYIMHTTVGGDPTTLGPEDSLVDLGTGEPISKK